MSETTEQIKCVKVLRPDTHRNMWCLYRMAGFDVEAEFDGAEIGERITLEYCEMTEEALRALPDFPGW